MRTYLDFEKPVAELEAKVEELRALGESDNAVAIVDDVARLEAKAAAALKDLYASLSPWQKTQVARHPQRPHFADYCAELIGDFTPLAGDRKFGEDEAIARSTEACLALGAPNVSVIIGEGGSGGAIAIATANKVLMLEHAIYGVISPEGAASILWRDAARAQDAATNMKITAQDLLRLGVVDSIVAEPVGGAHRDPKAAIATAGDAIAGALADLGNMGPNELRSHRSDKFLEIGRRL